MSSRKPGRWDWLLDRQLVIPSLVFFVVAWAAGYFAAIYADDLRYRWAPSPVRPALAALATGEPPPGDMQLGDIAHRFQPAPFNHGMHQQLEGVSCETCHHTGKDPETDNYPKCSSCHGEHPDLSKDAPSLKGAYHRQCLDCHRQRGEGPLGCMDCHLPAQPAEEGEPGAAH